MVDMCGMPMKNNNDCRCGIKDECKNHCRCGIKNEVNKYCRCGANNDYNNYCEPVQPINPCMQVKPIMECNQVQPVVQCMPVEPVMECNQVQQIDGSELKNYSMRCNPCVIEEVGYSQAYMAYQESMDILCKEESLYKGTMFKELVKPYEKGSMIRRNMMERC